MKTRKTILVIMAVLSFVAITWLCLAKSEIEIRQDLRTHFLANRVKDYRNLWGEWPSDFATLCSKTGGTREEFFPEHLDWRPEIKFESLGTRMKVDVIFEKPIRKKITYIVDDKLDEPLLRN